MLGFRGFKFPARPGFDAPAKKGLATKKRCFSNQKGFSTLCLLLPQRLSSRLR